MPEPEQTEAKLKAADIYRLLDQLHVYLGSSHAKVVPQKVEPDSCGNYVHLDGEAFLNGFALYLAAFEQNQEKTLSDLCLIMEISMYLRNGGVKAIMYRLETGTSNLNQDYYDALARQLCLMKEAGQFKPVLDESNSNLVSRLKQINHEDESRVSAAMTELEQFLLELSRKLEDKSDESLDQAGATPAAE